MNRLLDCLPSKAAPMESVDVQGLLMVKPHALSLGLDHIVELMLREEVHSCPGILAEPAFQETVKRVEVQAAIPRDLRSFNYGQSIIDLFYGDKADRRYYPLIQEWYIGKVIFLSFKLNPILPGGSVTDLETIKGTTRTFTENGIGIDSGTGIRGVLGTPYTLCNREVLDSMNDHEYRTAIEPVIQNFIHVCDKPGEAESALDLLS